MASQTPVACDANRRGGRSVSLPVLPGTAAARTVRRSRNGPRRAAVLVALHLLIAVHIILWLIFGMTLSPIEPSESMYTLEQGLVNAGFVFFVLAIASTLVFGRFVCGWGCHVVALQDLCGWLMKRAGVRPRPFRSRLLVYAPLGLALYMFVWPTLKREVVKPALGVRWEALAPYVGEAPLRPEFEAAFVKRDFWETFAAWYIAIPFLGVCGFATVYLLGAKGFCTYGCPYGGFFGPVDRLAAGRIVVSEACHQCGHCTAVCTSNVRVHEEIRDFGMVVDPGCMKCMDCVSVCPNGALSFAFARPSAFVRPRDEAAKKRARERRRRLHAYDLTRREEVAVGAAFVALLAAFRGMLDAVPLLMAGGMAAIGAFGAWKLWRLARTPNVRLASLQLRYRGRLSGAGRVFIAAAATYLALGAWSGLVRWNLYRGAALDARVPTPYGEVLAGAASPSEEDRRKAAAAIASLGRTASIRDGGLGWGLNAHGHLRLSRLHGILGDAPAMERHLGDAIMLEQPEPGHVDSLARLMARRGATEDAISEMYAAVGERHPRLGYARARVAQFDIRAGRREQGLAALDALVTEADLDGPTLVQVAEGYLFAGEAEKALAAARLAAAADPRSPHPRAKVAMILGSLGRGREAVEEMRAAAALAPDDPQVLLLLARVLRAEGREAEAAEAEEAALPMLQPP